MQYSFPDDMSNGPTPRVRNHRRSHSFTAAQFSHEMGPGAFISLPPKPTPKTTATFHIGGHDDGESSSQDEKDLNNQLTFARLSIDTTHLRSSFLVSPTTHSTLSRGSSHPILLSNGVPLKTSLKSPASPPTTPEELRSSLHLPVQSVPTTLYLSKSVHFPEKKEDGLECVKVFNQKARPANISTSGEDTETETEREDRFPFPRFGTIGSSLAKTTYEIDPATVSTIPSPNPPTHQNIHLESVTLHQPATPSSPLAPTAPHLTGTILVRNIAYEKHVTVRFTLDDWQTTSEVRAEHIVSVLSLPWEVGKTKTLGNAVAGATTPPTWDRFAFTIRLAYKLQDRTLYFVGRYSTGDGGGEWWDNNSGRDYKVTFKVVPEKGRKKPGRTLSAPSTLNLPVICVTELMIKSAVPKFDRFRVSHFDNFRQS